MATHAIAHPAQKTRRSLAGLGILTIAALLGTAVLLGIILFRLASEFDPLLIIIPAIPLIVAGVVAIGWRWAPILGAFAFGLLLLLLVGGVGGEVVYTLTHAGGPIVPLVLLLIPLLAVGFAASVGATVQNYCSAERRFPRWVPGTLLLVAGLSVGAAAVSSIPQRGDVSGVSAETLAALPAITLKAFDGGTIRVKSGETAAFRLENTDPVAHAFVVDELGVNAPLHAGRNSLALFKPMQPGTYRFYCTPHYNKVTGEGMHGTLIVE